MVDFRRVLLFIIGLLWRSWRRLFVSSSMSGVAPAVATGATTASLWSVSRVSPPAATLAASASVVVTVVAMGF